MALNYEFDNLDKKILQYLLANARMPFTDMAKKLVVSAGTIHQRVEKMREAGVITGSKITVDHMKMGFGVTTLLGLNLSSAKNIPKVVSALDKFPEVLEVHFTTGAYALIVKVLTKDIEHFHQFLVKKLQTINEIQSTESFISLDRPIDRDIDPIVLNNHL